MEILGSIKTYDWGTVGSKSKVAQFALKNDMHFATEFNESTPYAELWMGDHVSGPSVEKVSGKPISELIANDNSLAGGLSTLPYLFKVLSITKPLSIQVHPNKEQAERLHASRPDLYKDPNHKPEISIALTDFLALCGFRTPSEMHELLTRFAPLVELIGAETVDELQKQPNGESIRRCYTKLMQSPQDAIDKCITGLSAVLGATAGDELLRKVFDHCNHYFPNDIGVLSIFFLNIVEMKPGQAIFLAANEPHAYLSGDCMECMACSDNVIRAGLTPKFKDVETLLQSLDFTGKTVQEKFFQPSEIAAHLKLFNPPVKDFAVIEVKVPTEVQNLSIQNRANGSIIIVLKGNATAAIKGQASLQLKEGSIVFVPATAHSVDLAFNHPDQNGFLAYQAMYNDF